MKLKRFFKRSTNQTPADAPTPSLIAGLGNVIQFNWDKGTNTYYRITGIIGCLENGHNDLEIIECNIAGEPLANSKPAEITSNVHQEAFNKVEQADIVAEPRTFWEKFAPLPLRTHPR